MILTSEKEIPDEDEIPHGYDYYMYQIITEKRVCYGCFIGEDAHDLREIEEVVREYAGEIVDVVKVNREQYIDMWETLQAAKLKEQVDSVTSDSPAA